MKKKLIATALISIFLILGFLNGNGYISTAAAAEECKQPASCQSAEKLSITHGPILGRLSCDGIGVWIRTSKPTQFCVRYRPASGPGQEFFAYGQTHLDHDNTGWVHIKGLESNTEYTYAAEITGSGSRTPEATFKTLPNAEKFRDPEHNPRGLFNFSFEFACGNCQNLNTSIGPSLPAFKTMLDHFRF